MKYHYPLITLLLVLIFMYIGLEVVSFKEPVLKENNDPVLGFSTLLPTPAPYPFKQNLYNMPDTTANSVYIIDADSMIVLYEKNPNLRLFPASTTKIMTALVALENYPLNQVLTVPDKKIAGSVIYLKSGERLTVENLLYGMLIASGNDAAYVLSENFPGGTSAFVEEMNQKARQLNLLDTHFTNPVGYDENSHYSTAKDLALLAIYTLRNPFFAKVVSTRSTIISDVSGEIKHSLKNTNDLVGKVEGVKGVKTGSTEKAGECLVALIERNSQIIITSVLGSKNRLEETKLLSNWVFDNYLWQSIVPKLSYQR